jgi:mono/diheme cytochrome c family protein
MIRYFFISLFLAVFAALAILGFRGSFTTNRPIEIFPDMDHQAKFRPQSPTDFYANGSAARAPIDGTVAREMPAQNDYLHTGKIGDKWGDGIPLPIDADAMKRGQERFTINCAVCHGPAAYGNGIVKEYGLSTVANLQVARIRYMADGEIFNTITHGKNTMNAYGPNISVEDRWKIIAYLRAVQRSQNTLLSELPESLRAKYTPAAK